MKRDIITYKGVTFIRFPESKHLSSRRYYYPFANGKRVKGMGGLHQEIWRDNFGPIPKGMHVHHKDHDSLNNDPTNLELLTHQEHMARHGNSSPAQRAHFERIRLLAAAWHRSEAGKAFHSALGKKSWEGRKAVKKICVVCAKEYDGLMNRETDRFCSSACNQRWHYENKSYHQERKCEWCGKMFLTAKSRKCHCCSKRCAALRRYARERSEKENRA